METNVEGGGRIRDKCRRRRRKWRQVEKREEEVETSVGGGGRSGDKCRRGR